MKKTVNLLLAALAPVLFGLTAKAQVIIYSNVFNGGATSMNGTAPTVASNILGGTNTAHWVCTYTNGGTDADLANGTITANGACTLLPFKPQAGAIYYITASINVPASMGTWVSMGFSQTAPQAGVAGTERFTDGPAGWDWISARSGVNEQLFGGAKTAIPTTPLPNGMPTSGTYTLQILLNTFGAKWTASAFVNGTIMGTNVVGGTQIGTNVVYGANPTIGFVGYGQNTFTTSIAGIQWNYWALSTALAPLIGQQPTSQSVNSAGNYTNTVLAIADTNGGALRYQWYNNNVAIGGATNSALVINGVSTNNAGTNYYAVVTNTFGAATSSPVSLTVLTSPTLSAQLPVTYTSPFTLYAGASPKFSLTAGGSQPIYYQWYSNSVPVAGQTNPSITLNNLAVGTVTTYCVVSNSIGSTTSTTWVASVIADPTAPYPTSVLSLHPTGYWRLNEAEVDGNGDDGVVALDYEGGNDGVYTNVILGNDSYSGTDPSDTSALFSSFASPDSDVFGIQGVDFSASAGNSATFTVEAWAEGFGTMSSGAPVAAKGYNGGEQFALDINGSKYRFVVRDAAGNLYSATATTGPDGNWHHLVGVCDEVNGAVLLYVDGAQAGSASIPAGAGVLSTSSAMTIAARSSTPTGNNDLQFKGYINDVAVFNYALSSVQVVGEYSTVAPVAPYFLTTPPTNITVNGGTSVTLPATAAGSMPLGFYWTDVNGNTIVASGSTNGLPLNATLSVGSVPGNWNADQLKLTVTNSAGSANFTVSFTVYTNLQITGNLPSQLTLVSGADYTYSVGVVGAQPYHYQWYHAGTPIAGQTNSTYLALAGTPGSTTYDVVITNSYGAITSSVSTLTTISEPTNAYSAAILQLSPAGYWPMHEVEAAAHGNIETNYGSLGLLGTAYYPDWVADYHGFTRQAPGAIVGGDTSLHFNYNVGTLGNGAGTWTNEIYIPHNSPSATLNPPFAVECWFYPTNTGSGAASQSIWGQHGFEGLNAGYAGNGNGMVQGLQLAYSSSTIVVYGYFNGTQTAIVNVPSAPINNWYHVVVSCDASTNFTLYVNGTNGSSASGAGKYTPDYWTPLTIGGTRGGTRSACVSVDEFAVYTNTISDVSTHYADGTSGAAGAYANDVLNDHPVIYLKMNAPAYTTPAAANWPELINYGTIGNPGVYTPGTQPGIMAGPSTTNGSGYTGLFATNVAALSGVSSFADAGTASAYNPTGSNANFTVVATFRGNPCDNRVQSIVSHGSNSWQLNVTTNGTIVFNAGNGNSATSGTGQNPGDINTSKVYNDGQWHQVVAINSGNAVFLYVDGVLDTNGTPTGTTASSVIPGNSLDVMIGSDPSNTNNPTGVGRQFAGQICEVAFFNQDITSTQVQQLYNLAVTDSSVTVNTNPTNMLYSVNGSQLTLTWPLDHVGWTLQAQTNNAGGSITTNWLDVAGSASTNQVILPIVPTDGGVYYRLRYHP